MGGIPGRHRRCHRYAGGLKAALTDDSTAPGAVDFDGMTKAQLLEYAKENGISGVSAAMNKADILAAVKGQ